MAINEVPIGVYNDVTEIIDANGKAEIVDLSEILLSFIPDPESATATTEGVSGPAPEYDNVPPAFAVHFRAEIAAFLAAIAAAPEA